MHLNDTIPNISKVAVLLIIAFVVNLLFSSFGEIVFSRFYGPVEGSLFKWNVTIMSMGSVIFRSLLNIILAIWTYREAKKQNERPWIWTAFALFFGLIGVVAFYLLLVIRELRALRTGIEESNKKDH